MSFNNKVVIVTGASSGIGAATAVLFAKEGANVAIVARTQAKLETIARKIAEFGKNAFIIKADLSKEEDTATVVPRTVEHFGKLDVLVNNAAVTFEGSVLKGNLLEAYDKVMKTNVRSVIQLTTAAAPHLAKTKGNVINISGVLSMTVSESLLNLSTLFVSKAALNHFSRCAALELAPLGVRVNVVCPGPVDTEFLANNGIAVGNDQQQSLFDVVALGFIATDEEIGNLILFVASDKARSITGSNYVIDNGYLLKN